MAYGDVKINFSKERSMHGHLDTLVCTNAMKSIKSKEKGGEKGRGFNMISPTMGQIKVQTSQGKLKKSYVLKIIGASLAEKRCLETR